MAIAIGYDWPVSTPGTTTPPPAGTRPPTNIPASGAYSQVTAALTGDGATTSAVIVHNMNISATELTQAWPEVRFEPQISGTPGPWVISKTANNVTVGFSATQATSLGVFMLVRILKPLSAVK